MIIKFAQTAGKIIILLLIMIILLKLIKRMAKIITEKRKISAPLILGIHSILRWFIYISVTMIILQQAGLKINSLWTLITAASAMVAIGFVAMWSVLSNLLCTLMLVIFRPFQIGDKIEIIDPAMTAGIKGRVRNINMLFTTLLEINNNNHEAWLIHIPNNLFFQKIIKCKTGNQTYSLDEQLFEKESLLKSDTETEVKTK
ncbi:MAG: mechanosensitive ion channel [Desulfamplus sp.]|nr:mechanosensitive ion channel [Desulfamplus sp.]